jgi:hypothetical protein
VKERIIYEMALITFKVPQSANPIYLASQLEPYIAPRSLRSSNAPQQAIRRSRIEFGKQAFAVAAPSISNHIPASARLSNSVASFMKHLKTFFV